MTTLELPLKLGKKGQQNKSSNKNNTNGKNQNKKKNKNKFVKNDRGKIVKARSMVVQPKDDAMKESEMLAQHVDTGFLQSTTQIFVPDLVSVMEFIDQVIQRYAMCTEIFNYPNNIEPSYMGLYLQMCFLTYIKRNGQLTGASAGLVPIDMKGWAVPLAFARYLQGFGRYSEDGVSFESSLDHTTPLVIFKNGWGVGDGSTTLATRIMYPSNLTIMSMQFKNASASVELQPFFTNLMNPIKEESFTTAILTNVSEAIATAGLSFCWGENIPANAIDAAAYTYVNADVSTSTSPSCFFMSPGDKFHPEVALLYTKHSPMTTAVAAASYSCKCICKGMDTENGAPPWYLQPVGAVVFIMSEYKKWPKGSLHRLKYCKTRLETLFPVRVGLSWWGYANLVSQHYAALTLTATNSQQYKAGESIENNPDLSMFHYYCYQTACWMALAANWLRKIPYYRPYIVGTAIGISYTTQSFFASAAWLMVKLPAVIASAITDTGPVVYRGRLYYPDFTKKVLSPTSDTAVASAGTIWSPVSIGWVPPTGFNDSTDSFLGNNFFRNPVFQDTDFVKLVGFKLNEVELTIEVVQSLYGTAIPTNFYPVYTLNHFSNSIITDFYAYHSSISEASSMNKNLIHLHYEKCGATYQMLMNVSVSQAPNALVGGISLLPDNVAAHLPVGTDLSSYPQIICAYLSRSPAQIASLVQANADDVVLCVVYSMNITSQVAVAPGTTVKLVSYQVDGKYSMQLPAASNVASLVDDLIQETYAINSTFSSALAKRQALYRDNLSEGIMVAAIPPNMDHCFVGKLFKTAVRSVSSVLRVGVGLAAGAICGAATAAIGAEPAVLATTAACSVGARKIYDYIASRVGIDSNDIVTSRKTAAPGKKATKAGLDRSVAQVKQNLRTPSVAIAGSKM